MKLTSKEARNLLEIEKKQKMIDGLITVYVLAIVQEK